MATASGDVRFRFLGQVLQKPNNDGHLCEFLLPRNGAGKHMGSNRKAPVTSGSLTPGEPRHARRAAGAMRVQAIKQQQSTTLAHAATPLAQGGSPREPAPLREPPARGR